MLRHWKHKSSCPLQAHSTKHPIPRLSHFASLLLPLGSQLTCFAAIPNFCLGSQMSHPSTLFALSLGTVGPTLPKSCLVASFSSFVCKLRRRSWCDECILLLGMPKLSKKIKKNFVIFGPKKSLSPANYCGWLLVPFALLAVCPSFLNAVRKKSA